MAICLGQAPEDLYFNVKLIRSHLSSCLVVKKMKAFPSRRRNVKKRERSIETVPVYCKCRSTERGRMICRDTCSEWYYDTCIEVLGFYISICAAYCTKFRQIENPVNLPLLHRHTKHVSARACTGSLNYIILFI